jgi:predicted secreted protein
MKVVLVPHCALNQNARLAACAEWPAAVAPLVTGLMDRQIGVIQMPCPELMVIGLDRRHVQIRSGLEPHPVRAALRRLAENLVYQVRQYRSCGVRVLGILGKNGSPACGVEQTYRLEPCPGLGVFVEELRAELHRQGVSLPMMGLEDTRHAEALAVVDRWLAGVTPARKKGTPHRGAEAQRKKGRPRRSPRAGVL